MKNSDFQTGFPGRLVPTQFLQERDGRSLAIAGVAFAPNPLPPDLPRDSLVGSLYEVLDRAKTSLLRLEAAVSALPDPNILLRAMRTREAQASSKIENTVAGLDEVVLAEIGATGVRSEALEVQANRKAIEVGLSSTLPISKRFLQQVHRVLLDGVPKGRPGQFRDRQVYIGDDSLGFELARFVPPPAGEHLEASLRDWEQFVNPGTLQSSNRTSWPYLVELAFAHYQFEAIHPFSDGNGRVGRALVNIAPVKDGFLRYPVCNLSEWVQQNRQEYYDRLLRVSTHNQWKEWIEFFCRALAEQSSADLARGERVRKLRADYQKQLTSKRNSALLFKLIDYLFVTLGTTIPIAANHLGVSYTSAQKHVELLINFKVLTPASDAKRDRIFLAKGIIKAVRGKGDD